MAFINLRAREIQIKIVYYGPARSGKTANLRCIYALYRKRLVQNRFYVGSE
jgi:mutual gliding-motility protein MglA